MPKEPNYIAIFLIVVTALIILMVAFIITMLYLYTKKQNSFNNTIIQVKLDHAKTLMAAELEIQEQTFQNISREIHDNINLSLTLCKLNLNTIDLDSLGDVVQKIKSSVDLLSKAINDLSDISKSLNSDLIQQQGLIKAVEKEVYKIKQVGVLNIEWKLLGNPIYMDSQKELIIFRIIQEALNNIIKHSNAVSARLELNYFPTKLVVKISDNGRGFNVHHVRTSEHAGLKNMRARAMMLNGFMDVKSFPGAATTLLFTIPFEPYGEN